MSQQPDFTISDVLAFARSKPAGEAYDFWNVHNCALAQFSRAVGIPVFSQRRSKAEQYNNLGKHLIARPHTFGALADRLAALLPAKPNPWLDPATYVAADCGKVEA